MADATGLAEKMLGLEGFRIIAVQEDPAELIIHVETTATEALCQDCGARAGSAGSQGRRTP
jgi:hypothetical protein